MSSASPGSELRRLHALVGDLDAVVWEADACSGRFTFVSEGAREILGYPPAAFLETPSFWADHIHPDDRERAVTDFMASADQARPHDVEYRFLRPGGEIVWVRDIGHTVTDVAGQPTVVRGLMVDTTQQHLADERVEETQARYRNLIEHLPAIVYSESVFEQDGGVVYLSPQVRDVLGYAPDELIGRIDRWLAIIHPDDRDRVRVLNERSDRSGEPFVAEYRVSAADGRTVWVRDEAVLVRDDEGRALFWQGVMLDITERVRSAELERDLQAEREEAAELRALDEMKNTFLTAVSHDLRTPLAAILGLAVTLERQPLDPDAARELAGRIAANARKLDRMVTDLLDLDRLSRGMVGPNLAPTDLGALVARVVSESDVLSGREVTVDAHEVVVDVDGAKVERIVENLLANAARHTPAGSRIWVRSEGRPDGALIVVEDDGPGVPADLRTEIFQPFRQAETPEYSPGVGVGLALVARFAELHGGRAWVEDREGGGASFRVWLPGRAVAA